MLVFTFSNGLVCNHLCRLADTLFSPQIHELQLA